MAALSSPVKDADLRLEVVWPIVLCAGVDALYLSGRSDVPSELLQRLEESRHEAEAASAPIGFLLGESAFEIAPHGWGRYRYLIADEFGRIGFTTSHNLPEIRIQPRSDFLHAVGPEAVVEHYRGLLNQVCDEVHVSVSRIDLFVDITGWELDSSHKERFVCRAKDCRTFEEGSAFRGFQFGSRTSKTLSARIYDKSAEVLRHGSDWWYALWGDGYQPGVTVYRVEFEFARPCLAQFGLDTPSEVLSSRGSLWRYATSEWLTYRQPSSDATRSRWPLDEIWNLVEQAGIKEDKGIGIARVTHGRVAGSLRRIFPALTGYLAAFAAIVGTRGLYDTVNALSEQLRDDEIRRQVLFADRIDRRRRDMVLR